MDCSSQAIAGPKMDVKEAWAFARLDAFWQLDAPYSAAAKEDWDQKKIYCDSAQLDAIYDAVDCLREAMDQLEEVARDRLIFHLKRLPPLPDAPSECFEMAEILQVKRFLYHAHALLKLLPERAQNFFQIRSVGADLWSRLALGGMTESFYVADDYHEELPEIRSKIKEIDAQIEKMREAARAELASLGLDLAHQDFAVAEIAIAQKLLQNSRIVTVEPFDAERSLVRLAEQPEGLLLRAKRAALIERESQLESQVLKQLSKEISCVLEELRKFEQKLSAFDCAFCRARFAERFLLVRPRLQAQAPHFEEARFYPCMQDCQKLQLDYKPLSWNLDRSVHVLFGSNMGGKTTALQTVIFLQLLAQSGLYVPARFFETRVYRHCRYVGALTGDSWTGLSGFGCEIHGLVNAWPEFEEGALVVFDEFARTTSSREAEALLSALTEGLSEYPRSTFIFSTHFKGLERNERASFWRTEGLDRAALDAVQSSDLSERLRAINRCMRYGIVREEGELRESDALRIAQVLGLPQEIVDRAQRALTK